MTGCLVNDDAALTFAYTAMTGNDIVETAELLDQDRGVIEM